MICLGKGVSWGKVGIYLLAKVGELNIHIITWGVVAFISCHRESLVLLHIHLLVSGGDEAFSGSGGAHKTEFFFVVIIEEHSGFGRDESSE